MQLSPRHPHARLHNGAIEPRRLLTAPGKPMALWVRGSPRRCGGFGSSHGRDLRVVLRASCPDRAGTAAGAVGSRLGALERALGGMGWYPVPLLPAVQAEAGEAPGQQRALSGICGASGMGEHHLGGWNRSGGGGAWQKGWGP